MSQKDSIIKVIRVSECLQLLGSPAPNMTNERLAGDHPTTASANFLPAQPLA